MSIGTIKVELLARVGENAPIAIATIDMPIEVTSLDGHIKASIGQAFDEMAKELNSGAPAQ